MKKLLTLIFVILVVFAMAGCGDAYEVGELSTIEPDTYSNAFLELNEGSVTATSVEPIVIIADDFQLKTTGQGVIFFLEQAEDDGWHTLVPSAEVEGTSDPITFKMGKTTLSYKWEHIYGELPDGTYRVIGTFLTDDGETIYLSSEFTLPYVEDTDASEGSEDPEEEIAVPEGEETEDAEG